MQLRVGGGGAWRHFLQKSLFLLTLLLLPVLSNQNQIRLLTLLCLESFSFSFGFYRFFPMNSNLHVNELSVTQSPPTKGFLYEFLLYSVFLSQFLLPTVCFYTWKLLKSIWDSASVWGLAEENESQLRMFITGSVQCLWEFYFCWHQDRIHVN